MPTDAGSRGRGLILKAHAERIKPGPRPRNRRFSPGWRESWPRSASRKLPPFIVRGVPLPPIGGLNALSRPETANTQPGISTGKHFAASLQFAAKSKGRPKSDDFGSAPVSLIMPVR